MSAQFVTPLGNPISTGKHLEFFAERTITHLKRAIRHRNFGTLWERLDSEVRTVWYAYDGRLPITAFDSYTEARSWIKQADRTIAYRIIWSRPEWLS